MDSSAAVGTASAEVKAPEEATASAVQKSEPAAATEPEKQKPEPKDAAAPEQAEAKTASAPATPTKQSSTPSRPDSAKKARAALQGMWGSFSALANRVVHVVEAEAATIKNEQQAMKKEAALEKQPPPAKLPPWLDLGTEVTDDQRNKVARMVLELTSSSVNFLSIPIASQKEIRQVFIKKHAADGEELTPAERKHVANTEEVPEKDGFTFELNAALPAAEAALIADQRLARMRNVLVPRRISERNFWRNWLWRVHVIKTANGVTWPTPGIVTAKNSFSLPSASSVPVDANDSSNIEDEITMALDDLNDEQISGSTEATTAAHDDAWAKEVEAALADKP